MKRLNREVRKRLSFMLAALMLVLSVPQTALSVEAKAGENTGIVSEMTVESEKREEGSEADEVSEGTEETPETGEGAEGAEKTPETGEGAEGSEGTPGSGEGTEGSEGTPESGEVSEGTEETPDSGETSEDSEDSEETPETDENTEVEPEETEIVKASEEISAAESAADTFEVDYIIYEVISEQDRTVRVKGMNREEFNKIHMNGAVGIPPSDGPVELTIPAAVESEQVMWHVTEIGEFALADYMYDEWNYPGNANSTDVNLGEYFGFNLYISKVIVSPGITKIGKGAFYRTFQIDEIVLPDTVVEIGEAAFYFDEELRYNSDVQKPLKVNIPAGIKTISAYAYHGVFFVNTLRIPSGVEVIEEYAFACDSEMTGIYTVEIPSSVKKIKRYALDNAALINAALYQPNSPFPDKLDGSAEIEYATLMFGKSDKELTLYVPESLMDIYRLRLIYNLPNLQLRNIDEYREIKESPLRFLYDGIEFDWLTVPVSEPGLPEDIQSVTVDMGEADFQLDDIAWVFTVYSSEEKLAEEELKEYLRYEVKTDGTMSFVGLKPNIFTVTAKVDGYFPASFNMDVTDGGENKKFLDKVKALTAEDIAAMKKISYSPEIAFQLDEIRAMAEGITADCACDRDKILAVHTWLADYIAYDYDTFYCHKDEDSLYAETPYQPYEVLKNRYTVCGGYAGLAEDMLRSIGVPCAFVSGWVSGSSSCGYMYGGYASAHAWNMAYDGDEGKWIYFDATWDSVGSVNNNSISSRDVSEGRTLKWFDFDAEKEMKYGREFQQADFCEKTVYGYVGACRPYITLFPGEEGKFQALEKYHDVTFRLDDGFTDTDMIELDAEGNVKALKPGTVRVCIESKDADGYDCMEYGNVRVLIKDSFRFKKTEFEVEEEDYENKVICQLNENYVNYFTEMTSDDPDVVAVREDGTLVPKKTGTAVITARLIITAAENKPEVSCRVTVVGKRRLVNDERFQYRVMAEPSGSTPGEVEIIGHTLGSVEEIRYDKQLKLEIPELVTPDGKSYTVIGIGKDAFHESFEDDGVFTLTTELVLPDTLRYIEERAFCGWISCHEGRILHATVNFPASLERIEESAFDGFLLSGDVVFPEGSRLSYIGDRAFEVNHYLTKVDLSKCSLLREIGDGAFYCCSGAYNPYEEIGSPGLSEVTLPEGLKTIGASVFYGDNMLTSIRIPSTVESIGDYAFSSTGLTGTIDISGITALGKGVFSNSKIETVILPDGMEEISELFLAGTDNLKNVVSKSYLEELGGIENVRGGIFKLPASVRSIGDSAFVHTGFTGAVDISGVSELGTSVFGSSKGIETVILSDELEKISEESFVGTDNLKNVVSKSYLEESGGIENVRGGIFKLPGSVKSIGYDAFVNTGLTGTIDISGVSELGGRVFWGSKGIETIILPDGLKEIPEESFDLMYGLKSVVSKSRLEEWNAVNKEEGAVLLSDQITKIGASAFKYCKNIQYVEAPGVKELEKDAFYICEKLKEAAFSDELTVISDSAFGWCSALDSCHWGDHVEVIGEQAFYLCEQLGTSAGGAIELGRGLKSIGDRAFGKCTSVKKVTIYSKAIESIGEECFTSKPVLYVYKLPSGIYESALGGCVSEIIYMTEGLVLAESIAIDPAATVLYVGDTEQLVCKVLPENTDKPEVTWSSSDPDIALVQEGLVQAKKAGIAYITAATTDGSDLTAVCTVTVREESEGEEPEGSIDISNLQCGAVSNKTYTGEAVESLPNGAELSVDGLITLTDNAAGKHFELKKGQDYLTLYKNNVNAGTASVTIVGIGEYTGSRKLTYKILPRNLEGVKGDGGYAAAEVIFHESVLAYTGKAVTPSITVTAVIGGGRTSTLRQGKDYTIKYTNNIKSSEGAVKKPTVTITGKGNYKGKITGEFEIAGISIADVEFTPIQDQKSAAKKPVPVLKYNGKKLKNKTDFTLSYAEPQTDPQTGETTVSVNIAGKNNFTGSRTESFRIVDALISDKNVKITVSNMIYTGAGESSRPEIRVMIGKGKDALELKENMNYKVVYDPDLNAGKKKSVTVIGIGRIEGIGTFGGSKTITYKMEAKDINNRTADGKADVICQADYMSKEFFYTGNAVKPKVVLVDNTVMEDGVPKVLTENKDYILKYAGNRNVTANKPAVITIVGKGNYKGTFSVKPEFRITAWNLKDELEKENSAVRCEIEDQNYAGKALKPAVVISVIQPDGTEEVLKNNTAYKVTYRNNINAADKSAGTAAPTAVITPNKKAGMAASDDEKIERTFTIRPLDLADAVIKEIPDQKFKGKPVVPTPSVKIGKLTLQQKKGDIVFTYTGNSKRGIAKLKIKPGSNGNCTGERSVLYLIK